MCTVLHVMMIMTDTGVLEAEVMKEEDQEVGPLITTIEDPIVLESKCDVAVICQERLMFVSFKFF